MTVRLPTYYLLNTYLLPALFKYQANKITYVEFMAGDKPSGTDTGWSSTGWTSTPAAQQVVNTPVLLSGGPSYTTTTTTIPQSEFMVQSGGYNVPVSVAPGALYPLGATRITQRVQDTTGAMAVTAGGLSYQITQPNLAQQQVQQQVTQPQAVMPSVMINPQTGEFLWQGDKEYQYYIQPQSGSIVETFQGGKIIPTEGGGVTVEVPDQRFFGFGPDWKQVEIHKGKLVEVNKATSEQAATLLARGPAQQVVQKQGVGIPKDVAKFLESQGVDWGKELPDWEQQVYETGVAKNITGPEGSYFKIIPLAGGVSLEYQPGREPQNVQYVTSTLEGGGTRYSTFVNGKEVGSIDMPGATPSPTQQGLENMFPLTTAVGKGFDIMMSGAKQNLPDWLYEAGKASYQDFTFSVTAPIDIATHSMQVLGVDVKGMDLGVDVNNLRLTGNFQLGDITHPTIGGSGILEAVEANPIITVPVSAVQSAFGQKENLMFEKTQQFYTPEKIVNIVKAGVILGTGAVLLGGTGEGMQVGNVRLYNNFIPTVVGVGVTSLMTGQNPVAVAAGLGGASLGMTELHYMFAPETTPVAIAQAKAQPVEPQVLFKVGEKAEGTLEGGVKVTDIKEFVEPGIVNPDVLNRIMELQRTQGVPVKNIEVTAEGMKVTYPRGTFYPTENPFEGTLKAGGIEINPIKNIPTFYGETPTLPEGMMTSGYVPTDVSANFKMQYKIPITALPTPEVTVSKADVSAAYQFFDIKPRINPFEGIETIRYMTPEAAAKFSDIIAWKNAPEIPEMAGVKNLFGTDWRTAGNEIIKLPSTAEEPWYTGTGLEEKMLFQKISADYWTTGVKYQFFEPPEGTVVSPSSFEGTMLSSGIEKVEFNLPKGTPSWKIGDLGIETVSFKAPPSYNLKLTEGDKSLIEGMKQQNLIEEMHGAGELSGKNLDSLVQQEFQKLQERGQVLLSVKQVQAEQLGTEALAKNYGVSPQLFPYTVPQESGVSDMFITPKPTYDYATKTVSSNMFIQPAPSIRITQPVSERIQPFTVTQITTNTKQSDVINNRFKFPEATRTFEQPKVTDLFKVSPVEIQNVFHKESSTQITIFPDVPPPPPIHWDTDIPPPPPPPTFKKITGFPKDMGELPWLQGSRKRFGFPKQGKGKTTFAPISDLWSRSASEFRTGKIAHSPSLKVAQKFWKQTGGEFIPTAEMLSMKPRKPQKPFKMPKVSRPKAVRKQNGMSGMSMKHVMKGFKMR
jgi:hypothetical protein